VSAAARCGLFLMLIIGVFDRVEAADVERVAWGQTTGLFNALCLSVGLRRDFSLCRRESV
jgi:hypothetical protein